MIWLKVTIDNNLSGAWPVRDQKILISIHDQNHVPVDKDEHSFRISPLFPLIRGTVPAKIDICEIHFVSVDAAFNLLARLEKQAGDAVKNSIFFSCGLASIVLISDDKEIIKEFYDIVGDTFYAREVWQIKNGSVADISYVIKETVNKVHHLRLPDYSMLNVSERATIDEFVAGMQLILIKLNSHTPAELLKMQKLINEMTGLVEQMIYLTNFHGSVPSGLNEYNEADLKESVLNHILKQQNLDRIIQVSSALTYVSTQAFSGAIPILERRSLIRRHSLLGIGSALSALNQIARYIENCFNKVNFEDIVDRMGKAPGLPGVGKGVLFDTQNWSEGSVNGFKDTPKEIDYYKLPYFSGRLGFRETEYSIAASMQSIAGGSSMEWSLMTLTHEMLHGHVRTLLGSIMETSSQKTEEFRQSAFEKFIEIFEWKTGAKCSLIDSIRQVIFGYCCLTDSHGSIAVKNATDSKFEVIKPESDLLWDIMERENRNISEIFVHVMDLHYFYGSSVAVYIPLIWGSWIAVPHIKGDIRQYILRTLLAIASIEASTGSAHSRFGNSVSILQEQLKEYSATKLNHSTIHTVLEILNDKEHLENYYFYAFKASLLIVDLVKNVFISSTVRAAIFEDEKVGWLTEDETSDNLSDTLSYNLPDGFQDEIIESPVAFLLHRMIYKLNQTDKEWAADDIERDTAQQFLALFSHQQNRNNERPI